MPKKGYIHFDPLFRFLRRSQRPFEWLEARYDPDEEPRAAEVMRRRMDLSFTQGFVVPVLGPFGSKGCVSISGPKLDLAARTKPAIHLMAVYAFDRACRVGSRTAPKPILTSREREVLTWVAAGKTAWEIGEILSIAKRTVDEHVRTAFQKLGATNRTQAVALALRDQLIAI